MAQETDEAATEKTAHDIGQDVSLLSVDELTTRVRLLNDEIARLKAAIDKKQASRDVAASFFKS